jgi:uncharacterized protein (TIGR02996 family)
MTPEAGFLQDICENPDDDLPRLVYADWLEDNGDPDRAEFIRVQVRRARLGEDPAAGPLVRRAAGLLQEHWDEWVRPLARLLAKPREGWLRGDYHPEALYKFRRGFISILDLDTGWFVEHAEELFRLAPLRHVRLFGAGAVADRLARCPQLRCLEGIDFVDYHQDPIDARAMARLADSPHLGRLRVLGLYQNNLGDAGAAELARAKWLARVVTLELGQTGLSGVGGRALAETPHAFRPRRLRLGNNPLGNEGVTALAQSPVLSQVRHLTLDRCEVGSEGAAALLLSPHLRAVAWLDLSNNPIGVEVRRLLEASEWAKRGSLRL